MKVSEPTVSHADQLSFTKVEKLRGVDADDIRRALVMVCGDKALDRNSITNVAALVDALSTEDQISYVKVETLRNINPIKDVHRAVQNICGGKAFSSSTYTRWSSRFRQGKSVRLGYEKPPPDVRNPHLIKTIVNHEGTASVESEDSANVSDDEASMT